MATSDTLLTFPPPASSSNPCQIPTLLGNSASALQLRAQLRRVGPYFRAALLCGESGTGHEDVARALHTHSPAADRPFAVLTAAEAEERFAASAPPPTEGLLYLPEIDELSLAAQTRLLAMLRDRTAPRIVAWSRHGLRPLVSAGAFSTELAATLTALRIVLPPLRERSSDIPEFIRHYLRCAADTLRSRPVYLTDAFPAAAMRFAWPGNLTQLRLTMQWLVEHRAGRSLTPDDLHAAIDATRRTTRDERRAPRLVPLDHVIHEHIRSVLVACNGNKLRASEVLGISRSTLYRMLETPLGGNTLALAG